MKMKYVLYFLFLLVCLDIDASLAPLNIPQETIQKISERVWKNECGGRIEGLTHWNENENFPSFGIAHYIWYIKGKEARFEETFPTLLLFLQSEGVVLPNWLKNANGCPWQSREQFYQKFQSQEMVTLRDLLVKTKDLQGLFIAKRLEKTLDQIVAALPDRDKQRVSSLLQKLAQDPQGLYALIDYLNCKGSGLSPKETYRGQGWGLTQVLLQIPASSTNPLVDFVESAKKVLTERVKNSPPENQEERWLKGWHNRIHTYLEAK